MHIINDKKDYLCNLNFDETAKIFYNYPFFLFQILITYKFFGKINLNKKIQRHCYYLKN